MGKRDAKQVERKPKTPREAESYALREGRRRGIPVHVEQRGKHRGLVIESEHGRSFVPTGNRPNDEFKIGTGNSIWDAFKRLGLAIVVLFVVLAMVKPELLVKMIGLLV